ncbi:Zinc finger BED domain-containing protein RICESLEEPER 1 [Rhynchospora pubera]|uniref:Zinc finger BED domain-containing protein RICESLEEPER 1 n=1 Tax=Rhynchospora pubera TaxID=906938 RepID=A0AAV8D2E3_9POAL|nr:Zinc finger BED domain-containing protein RICESLEEPER 1 [Rhynchospora pubera]
MNYMCLTAHWIDSDWKLNHKILNFCVVPDHKGDTIGKTIEECLIELGITADNATSNNGAISYLKRKTKDWKCTILDHKYIHLRCCAHIVNLIVKEGLDEHFESIQKIRKAVKYVKSSPKRLLAFKDCVEKEKIKCKSLLCLDVETRWNSTYFMLVCAEKFEKAFERLGDTDREYHLYFYGADGDVHNKGKGKVVNSPPEEVDWVKARCFVKFLKLFYGVTMRLSGSSYAISHCFFHELVSIQTRLNEVSKACDHELKIMAEGMKLKFKKYWENSCNLNLLLYIAVVLDPRYKLKYVKFCLEKMYPADIAYGLMIDVNDAMESLYADHFQHHGKVNSSADGGAAIKGGVSSSLNGGLSSVDVDDENYSKFVKSQFKRHLMEEECIESKSEVAKYLAEPCDNRYEMSFDIFVRKLLNFNFVTNYA